MALPNHISTTLHANLDRVFNERDPDRRQQAIRALYAPDAKLYEPQATFAGIDAIVEAVTRLLGTLPPTLAFVAIAPAQVNHDLGKLVWKAQLPDGTVTVTGTDVARVVDGRIEALYVFLDV